MKRYYTALGKYMPGSDFIHAMVATGNEILELDFHEMNLWSVLAGQVFTHEELEISCENRLSKIQVQSDRGMDAVLNRLQARGLVAVGTGERDIDALYDLVGDLNLYVSVGSFPLRLGIFLRTWFYYGTPFGVAQQILQKPRLTSLEKKLKRMAGKANFTTSELIAYCSKQEGGKVSDKKLEEVLYSDDETTSDNLFFSARYMPSCKDITEAVLNLYLSRQIIFVRF